MKFVLEIECDNAAFDDDPKRELARILHEQAAKLGHWAGDGSTKWRDHLYDVNGNKVGHAELKP
jgi:hypothetical protein